ncbi:MAG TPA: 3-hydroxyacyl-CoA dehydrogenase NAD-binding domain-containing protein [Nitrospiria bacterium]|nr:3-hydroxyacyl-CoA dehydrogenase NAD-binding domain-containing protein [Nitrospiria bacterium]HUK55597.1 3-hydroxyacyl-CoA dehydrogenase NAD-binding domain-containing protein [Nitrospiria bacterium]
MNIKKAAVIGAGTMGAQIAQVISHAGVPVILMDIHEDGVARGLETIRKIYQTRVDKGRMKAAEAEQKAALVVGASNYDGFGDVDVVIEAVFEEMEVKRKVFTALDAACPPRTVLATNTSSLSISAIASVTRRPKQVIGMHFFNPVYAMKLVEVIPGLDTSPETVHDVVALAERLGKTPIRVRECPGFVVNRLLMPYLNEAALALQEGAASANEIDGAMKAFGMPMGPFTLLDMIGIDIAEKVSQILYDAYGPRMAVAEILSEMVAAKRFGRKSGAGVYRYDDENDEQMTQILQKVRKNVGVAETGFAPERLLLLMINEAAICLQEGTATAGDLDLAMVFGTGFPREKGGPLHYADQVGLDVLLKELQRHAASLGPRFWPAPIIKRMVGAGYIGLKSRRGFFTY